MEPGRLFSEDASKTALLMCDHQNLIMGGVFGNREKLQAGVERSSALLEAARASGVLVIHVVVQFRPGYPEIGDSLKLFSALTARIGDKLHEDSPTAQIHRDVAPLPTEPIVRKRRVGAFWSTDLEAILRANKIENIVLAGFSTSGVILSSQVWAADLGFQVAVIEDCCADKDDEVHRVLTSKVFLKQGFVFRSGELMVTAGGQPSAPPQKVPPEEEQGGGEENEEQPAAGGGGGGAAVPPPAEEKPVQE